MNKQEYIREQEELAIKYGVKKYAEELFADELTAAKNVPVPGDAAREKALARKVVSNRKVRRLAVLVAIFLAALLAVGMSAGAFGNLWKWLTAQINNDTLIFTDTDAASFVYTADGVPANDIYAELSAQCPEVELIVPGWLPDGAVLENFKYKKDAKKVELIYSFEGNSIFLTAQKADLYADGNKYPLQGNTHESGTIKIMGQEAEYVRIINELGDHLYTASWKNAAGTTRYSLQTVSSSTDTFNKVIQKLYTYK